MSTKTKDLNAFADRLYHKINMLPCFYSVLLLIHHGHTHHIIYIYILLYLAIHRHLSVFFCLP